MMKIPNYSDMIYVWGGIVNSFLQLGNSFAFQNKLIMSLIMIQQIVKTFNFLRIFSKLSYLTTMLKTVMVDLQPFMLFYVIIIFMFGMIFAVVGIGNVILPGDLR